VREAKYINKFTYQFFFFNCLQHLFMFCVHFLISQMNQVLGFLVTPLKTLSISYSLISQRDLDSFSCCQILFQLKHLGLRGVVLLDFDLMRCLLMKVVSTLETLDLQGCRVNDSQLNALLPGFKQSTQISNVNFYNSDFSMPILKDLSQ
ncbi:mCG1036328, partial [Mus musculus]